MSATTPGLVCAHHHFYSALARGMPAPPRAPRSFREILELIWWRLDQALDLEMIRWSAKLGALEALERGTTAIIDHHASPNAIEGSLAVIAERLPRSRRASRDLLRSNRPPWARRREGGARGERAAPEGLRLERAAIRRGPRLFHAIRRYPRQGLRSSPPISTPAFTSTSPRDPRTENREKRLEARARDELAPRSRASTSIVELPGTIAHNPLSNMNNSVGYASPASKPNRIVLGSDGIGARHDRVFPHGVSAASGGGLRRVSGDRVEVARGGVGVSSPKRARTA